MSQQLDFLEPMEQPARDKSLFLAIFPPEWAIRRIETAAPVWMEKNKVEARLRPFDLMHSTLHYFDHYSVIQDRLLQSISTVLQPLTSAASPFPMTLDRLASFGGRPGNHPVVLTDGGTGNPQLREFHQNLVSGLVRQGCPVKKSPKFAPHLTLLYGPLELREQAVEPISWMVDEVVLVCSHVGKTRYEKLASWKLEA